MHHTFSTKGHGDTIDITSAVVAAVEKSGVSSGLANIFVVGSTAALTITEYEPGIIYDINHVLEKVAPEAADYKHHERWQDHNGAAHIKAAIIGPDLNIPIEDGKMQLGTWQQIVLIDFDERPRERRVIVKIIKQ